MDYNSRLTRIMGIEGGSIGSVVDSAVSGIKGGVPSPSFGAVPSLAGLGEFGQPMGIADIGSIINEGPVGLSDLEGLKPMGKIDLGAVDLTGGSFQPDFDLGGEILFQAEPELNEASVLTEAESILAMGRIEPLAEAPNEEVGSPVIIAPEIKHVSADALVIEEEPKQCLVEPMVYPELPTWDITAPKSVFVTVIEEAEEVAQKAWDNHVLTQTENLVNDTEEEAPAVISVGDEVLEGAEEEENDEEEKKPREILEEEESVEREFYLEDEQAASQRKHEIKTAIVKARIEAGRLGLKKIAGWLVAKFLPSEHQGNRSQIVKKTGPDGSYQETVAAIYGAGELESEEQAVKRFSMVVAEKKPVKRGKKGTPVAGHDVARVLKYFFIKARPAEQLVIRVAKKQKILPVVSSVRPETKETRIEDLGLAEVFPKTVA